MQEIHHLLQQTQGHPRQMQSGDHLHRPPKTESEGRQTETVFTSCDCRINLGISRSFFLSRPLVYNSGTGSEVRYDYNEKALTWLEVLNLGTNACRPPHLRKGSAKLQIERLEYGLMVVPRSIEITSLSSPWYLGEVSIVKV